MNSLSRHLRLSAVLGTIVLGAEDGEIVGRDDAGDKGTHPPSALRRVLDNALSTQRPVVLAHLATVRRRHPGVADTVILAHLEKQYVLSVSTLGLAAGGTAAMPGGGTALSVSLTILEVGTFLELTTLFALSVAELHGIEVLDVDRRRALLLTIILGNSGSRVVEQVAGRIGPHWGRTIVTAIPLQKIRAVNRALGHNFVTKYGRKQGILVLGRAVPAGLGAIIGAAGNAALGYGSVRAARSAFGPLPDSMR